MTQSLWDFSGALYARPGVAGLCLTLQDEAGADVCLLLTALWLERRGVAASTERVVQLEELARPWQTTVTTPLRALRRAWKEAAQNDAELAELRGQLAALELQAERRLLERLHGLTADWPATSERRAGTWLEMLAATWSSVSAEHRAALQQLRDAATGLTQP